MAEFGVIPETFELKYNLTKQTVEDAIEQYRRDRDSRELLFKFGRCMVHFAMDDLQVKMCTDLKGKLSWFLPFNQGWNDGAGNPPNPYGIKTDYLWKRLLTPQGLTAIIENYAQIVKEKNPKTDKKISKQIFPRFHQLEVVRRLLADVAWNGAGKRYLIQHSTGSGKSNSIAWLAHQLIGIHKNGKAVFESIIVITDRRILDDQIKNTIRQYAQVSATVGHARHSKDLRKFIESGKKIIISTIQKFPEILDEIEDRHRGRTFAILIDEAHSSQGGKTSAAMIIVLDDKDAEIEPIPIGAGGRIVDPQIDYLSNILASFNQQFGTLFTDADRYPNALKMILLQRWQPTKATRMQKKIRPRQHELNMTRCLNVLSYPC
ncbi:MAG: DEAD/DEAH box helicase family protein [Desulfobacterales bacterium]